MKRFASLRFNPLAFTAGISAAFVGGAIAADRLKTIQLPSMEIALLTIFFLTCLAVVLKNSK